MFRKNYLPKLNVYQDTDGKWFASNPPTVDFPECFVQCLGLGYEVFTGVDATKFDTLELLMQALYEYACFKHIDSIKNHTTYSKAKVVM